VAGRSFEAGLEAVLTLIGFEFIPGHLADIISRMTQINITGRYAITTYA
jgi:hypothetical protein